MNVIFKNIPTGIKKYELAKFIESTFNKGGMNREDLYVPIGDIAIWQTQGGDVGSLEQFGVVRICPPDMAKKVVKKLHGCSFNKFQILVREFFSRSTNNDPRLRNHDSPELFKEQRMSDRRQHSLMNTRQL